MYTSFASKNQTKNYKTLKILNYKMIEEIEVQKKKSQADKNTSIRHLGL